MSVCACNPNRLQVAVRTARARAKQHRDSVLHATGGGSDDAATQESVTAPAQTGPTSTAEEPKRAIAIRVPKWSVDGKQHRKPASSVTSSNGGLRRGSPLPGPLTVVPQAPPWPGSPRRQHTGGLGKRPGQARTRLVLVQVAPGSLQSAPDRDGLQIPLMEGPGPRVGTPGRAGVVPSPQLEPTHRPPSHASPRPWSPHSTALAVVDSAGQSPVAVQVAAEDRDNSGGEATTAGQSPSMSIPLILTSPTGRFCS
jgi:hypothetical protein